MLVEGIIPPLHNRPRGLRLPRSTPVARGKRGKKASKLCWISSTLHLTSLIHTEDGS